MEGAWLNILATVFTAAALAGAGLLLRVVIKVEVMSKEIKSVTRRFDSLEADVDALAGRPPRRPNRSVRRVPGALLAVLLLLTLNACAATDSMGLTELHDEPVYDVSGAPVLDERGEPLTRPQRRMTREAHVAREAVADTGLSGEAVAVGVTVLAGLLGVGGYKGARAASRRRREQHEQIQGDAGFRAPSVAAPTGKSNKKA